MLDAAGAAGGSASACLQQYIAARQQVETPDSAAAANSAFSSYTAAAQQLYIQPLCLAGSPTAASSSPGIASSGRLPAADMMTHKLSGNMQGPVAHAYLFKPGSKSQLGFGHKAWGHVDTVTPTQAESAQQAELHLQTHQPLAGAAYADAKLEPFRPLPDKEDSARVKFDGLSMGLKEAASYAAAASDLAGPQQNAATASHSTKDLIPQEHEAGNMSRLLSGKLERESSQGRTAARRMKLHAMLDSL